MQPLTDQIQVLVQDNNSDVVDLTVQMLQLGAVQTAIANLMERIDETTCKGLHKDGTLAYLFIMEIEKTLRLIDYGFEHLYSEMREKVDGISASSDQLFDTLVKSQDE